MVCFHTTLRPSKHIFPDYNAVLLEISGPLCSVKFNDGMILNDVQLEFVFSPGEYLKNKIICKIFERTSERLRYMLEIYFTIQLRGIVKCAF